MTWLAMGTWNASICTFTWCWQTLQEGGMLKHRLRTYKTVVLDPIQYPACIGMSACHYHRMTAACASRTLARATACTPLNMASTAGRVLLHIRNAARPHMPAEGLQQESIPQKKRRHRQSVLGVAPLLLQFSPSKLQLIVKAKQVPAACLLQAWPCRRRQGRLERSAGRPAAQRAADPPARHQRARPSRA